MNQYKISREQKIPNKKLPLPSVFGLAVFWKGLILLLIGALTGCSEIFEQDISGKMVQIMAPADSAASGAVSQTFRWQALEGAREYRLQIGSPSLANSSNFFLDTLTNRTSLRLLLKAGRFEWQLTARNAGYESASAGRFLLIEPSTNLAEQSFRLLAPANKSLQSSNTVTFRWEALPMADRYVFKLDNRPADTVQTAQVVKTLPTEARSYTWQVTALNATSQKAADESFTFQISLTAPAQPVLLSPADNSDLQSLPVTFSWQRGTAEVIRDSLYLYTANQTLISGFPRAVSANSYTLQRSSTALSAGTYSWAVRSVSTNGRVSSMSERRTFRLLF